MWGVLEQLSQHLTLFRSQFIWFLEEGPHTAFQQLIFGWRQALFQSLEFWLAQLVGRLVVVAGYMKAIHHNASGFQLFPRGFGIAFVHIKAHGVDGMHSHNGIERREAMIVSF